MKEIIPSAAGISPRLIRGWISIALNARSVAVNLLLLGLWTWLYGPVFRYMAVIFTREEFRTNQIVLAAVTALLLYQFRKARLPLRFDIAPRLFLPGLVMMVAGTLVYLLVERFLDINTLSALLFGLASYGLIGLWLSPDRWKQGLPAMLMVIGVLPFGEHMETFAGYPLRVFTADMARSGLGAFGFRSVGIDTILVFESGISQVDIPCSGVKSLWTGALFLLAATWIENRLINARWMLVAAATGSLLFLSNLLRVAILALTGPALGWVQFARMLHVPLGVLGFTGTCAAALLLLHRLPGRAEAIGAQERTRDSWWMQRPAWLAPLLAGFVLVMAILYTPRSADPVTAAEGTLVWRFPASFQVQSAPLSERELELIRQGGAETAERFTFHWQDAAEPSNAAQPVSGTVMLVTSRTWRGQHRPERCFTVFGLTIDQSSTQLVEPDFPLRFLSLSGSGAGGRASAAYWLQSASKTTEDFGQRVWADMALQRERWVLVTVLLDREYGSQSPEIYRMFAELRGSVHRSFVEGGVP